MRRSGDGSDVWRRGQKMMNRWWRVAGALLMNLPLGALYAWSIFVLPLEKEFGWTRTQTSWVFTIAVFVFGLSFIAAGRLQDKKGPFWISVAGSVLFSLGWVLATYAKDLSLPVSHDGSRAGDRQRVRVRHADPGIVEVVSRSEGAGGGARRGGVRRRILHHLLHRTADAYRLRLAGHVPVLGDRVLRRDDDRGVHPAEPAGGMETAGLGAGGGDRESHGVEARVRSGRGGQDLRLLLHVDRICPRRPARGSC